MAKRDGHSRREFLQGRAAVRAMAQRAQALVESIPGGLSETELPESAMQVSATRRAMACEFAVQYHAEDIGAAHHAIEALDLIERLEDQMTVYRDHSAVIDINERAAEAPVVVEQGLFELLVLSRDLYIASSGAFDITSGPLSRAWGFFHRSGDLPSENDLKEALDRVGFHQVELESELRTIRFSNPRVEINLNSIGKGYALDRAAALMDGAGVTDYLCHGGRSSVLARGCNRADDRESWTIGLRHPYNPQQYLAQLHLNDRALGTAGGATQSFEHQGRQLSHLLDPRTGWPVEGMFTATAIAPTAAQADALATAFFVMGTEEVDQYCRQNPGIGAVLISHSGDQGGLKLSASGLADDEWIDYTAQVEH